MSIFNKTNTVDSLQNESAGVLSVFRQTVQKLGDINSRAAKEREAKLAEAVRLQNEAEQLDTLCSDNANVIANINSLIKPEK